VLPSTSLLLLLCYATGCDHGEETPQADTAANFQSHGFNLHSYPAGTSETNESTAPPTKRAAAAAAASGAGADISPATARVGLALTKLVWLLRDVCECTPIVEARPDLVLLCLDPATGPASATGASINTSSTSRSTIAEIAGVARTVVGLYFRLACRLPCADTTLPGMHLEGSHLEDKRVNQAGMCVYMCVELCARETVKILVLKK